MNSEKALQRYAALESEIDMHADNLTEIASKSGDLLEGNCFTIHQTTTRNEDLRSKRVNLLELARHGPKILEVGFNAGHSALLFLMGCSPDAEITFLDLGAHEYVVPCYEYLQSKFPAAKLLMRSNSLHYLPHIVLKDGLHDIYDIIHMDGGHDEACVMNDMILLYILLKKGGYMCIDDAEGFILEQTNRFCQLGLFENVEGVLPTKGYPHKIVRKV